MKKIPTSITLVFLLTCWSHILFSQEDGDGWELARLKDGVEVYTRTPEGSKFKEYKALATIEAEPKKLVEIIEDVDTYTDWMANIKNTELLARPDSAVFISYTEAKVPWPFDNRDNVTKSVISYDPVTGTYTIDIYMIPDYIPEKKGIIRIADGEGKWIFTPTEDGKTEVYHQFIADPAGKIPAWLVNMFIVDGPHKTMLGLIGEAGSRD
jgi:hypothetical protein